MIEIAFTEVGSILLTGYEQNFQSTVTRILTAQHLKRGGTVIALVDSEADGKEQTAAMADALRSLDIKHAALDRFHILPDVRKYQTSDSLAAAIKTRWPLASSVLLLRDLGTSMGEVLPGASWLDIAEQVALLLDVRVLTVAHHGRPGIPAPNYAKFTADEVWQCVAGLNLGLTLKRIKPAETTVHLTGATLPYGTITFENTEKPHAFAQ